MRTETLDRSRGGMWPWLGQRVTAVVIIVTIMVHLVLTHFVAIGELSYDNIGERLASGAVLVNDVLLLVAVVFHALNGVRMVALDWGLSGAGARRGVRPVPLGGRRGRHRLRHLGPLGLGELRGSACHTISSSWSAAGSRGSAPPWRPSAAGIDVAILSQVHPGRSHSGAAQGGINAALANHPDAHDDTPEKHAFDTVKGSRLPGRPGRRHPDDQGRPRRHLRDGPLGLPVQPLRRRAHRPAAVRRRRLPAHLLRRRQDRPLPAAHAGRAAPTSAGSRCTSRCSSPR